MSLTCLDNIIGLSQTDCNCFDAGKPADFNTTTSGYFLDELEGINLTMADCLDDCTDGSLWELMQSSRTIATDTFQGELLAFIQSDSNLAKKPFKGLIGERSWTSSLPKLGDYHGIRIKPCHEIKGAFVYISQITSFMNLTKATIPIEIWNNIDDVPLYSFNIASEVNKAKNNDVTAENIILPLYDERCTDEDLEYYILYQPTDFLPLNNKIDCGCKGRKFAWKDYFDVNGAYGDDTSSLKDFRSDAYANGITLRVETGCSLDDLICDNISSVSPTTIQRVIGKTIQFKAGEILIEKILSSGAVNRYTLLENERLWGKRNHYKAEYQSRLEWLSEEIDISDNDCLTCDGGSVIAKRTIFS